LIPKPKVVVFILNYNSLDFKFTVYESIESALRISYPQLDVVVIDNASSDGSFEAIRDRFGKDVILIRLDRNYGYSGGNEFGFERYNEERGSLDYAVFMNNDFTITNEDFAKDLVGFLERSEDVVLAQGFNLNGDRVHVDSAGHFVDGLLRVIARYNGLKISECPYKNSYVTYTSSSCFISKVKVIREVRGYFFEPKFFGLWDESDLAFNMWSYGLKSMFIATTVGIHQVNRSFGKFPFLTEYLFMRNKYALRRHYLNVPLFRQLIRDI
jgi:GT2 family glycosyltransferase